jgi:hypothetical protein
VTDDSSVIKAAIDIVKPLLSEDKIVAVQFIPPAKRYPDHPLDQNGYETWRMLPEQVVARIESEWRDLGRDPRFGEIVWFTIPGGP